MTDIDEARTNFETKLEAQRAQSSARLEQDLKFLRSDLVREFKASLPADWERPSDALVSGGALASPPIQALLDLSSSTRLQDLDEAFIQRFQLGKYYSLNRLRYPTVYCESLEEFFTPLVTQLELSASARQGELARLVKQAQETARTYDGGGIFGYNLPGSGAYLNGWLFVYGRDLPPRQAFERPDLLRQVFATAAHEKLGHGFLFAYSALGGVKTKLGLAQFDTAARFGLRTSDDPTSSLRREQSNLLFEASQLLEEGWSTWIENLLVPAGPGGRRVRYQIPQIVDAIHSLPVGIPERQELQQVLMASIGVLFGEKPTPLESIHQAVIILNNVGTGLNDTFANKLGQPLRYAVGELILSQAEANLGMEIVPYAALIAANISFDPAAISLSDLRDLLGRDPRLHPDARLAALSRVRLSGTKDIPALVRHATEKMSLSVPKELQ